MYRLPTLLLAGLITAACERAPECELARDCDAPANACVAHRCVAVEGCLPDSACITDTDCPFGAICAPAADLSCGCTFIVDFRLGVDAFVSDGGELCDPNDGTFCRAAGLVVTGSDLGEATFDVTWPVDRRQRLVRLSSSYARAHLSLPAFHDMRPGTYEVQVSSQTGQVLGVLRLLPEFPWAQWTP